MSGANGSSDTGMDYPLCERCGFDAETIQDRIRLLELDQPEMAIRGQELHQRVIAPNLDSIVNGFYGSLTDLEEFSRVAEDAATASRLRDRQETYLLGLGIGFSELEYFEERLRIGVVHHQVGIPQSLYQCTYQRLQSLLIDNIPDVHREVESEYEAMLRFILTITALDMSLAAESYCVARVSDLKESLASERNKIERLRELAVTDWLTNLHNHSYSRRCLESALKQSIAFGSPLCIIMADLDHFKAINDDYGHLVGDQVLQIAAARMLSAARTDDEICRYGGEEFLFILQNTELPEGAEVAERVRARIHDDTMHSGNRQITLSLSLGIAQADPSDSVDSLIERADAALYEAKRTGRNRVCIR